MEYQREYLYEELRKCYCCKRYIETKKYILIANKYFHKICYLYTFNNGCFAKKIVGKGEVIGEPRFY
jgi:hypothetical protein